MRKLGRLAAVAAMVVAVEAAAQEGDGGEASVVVPGVLPEFVASSILTDRNGTGALEILAFGDSITRGTGDFTDPGEKVHDPSQPAPGVEAGYPLRIENTFGVQVRQLGEPGEQIVRDGLYRFAGNVPQIRPDVILISGGSNDAQRRIDSPDYARTIQTMLNIAMASGITPVLITIPPVCCEHTGQEPYIESYNRELENLARINDVTLAHVAHGFDNTCQGEDCHLLNLPEGLHPNTVGYDVMAEIVMAALLHINIFALDGPTLLETALGLAPGTVTTVPDPAPPPAL